ncbi:uncharacterized protein TM35_000014490 [Trypanosoma theileri]|uniref:Uncharacterized protein n=1 Tax=Trypanosoma theileri TaxID=67003 RepID=A0A1X0P9H2_9TRYP|nr:uncharacterized protein TM35_000014490 [Trypanosoma theileri]ORC93572.1 hypothetical protein TM35_000014490 [Trypanosoma theileri]
MSTISSFSRTEDNTEVGNGDGAGSMFQQPQQQQHQQRMEDLLSHGSPLQAGSRDDYEQSELSRITQCGSTYGVQETASTTFVVEIKGTPNTRSNVEHESKQLNKEALSKLEKVVAAGGLPLRSELLGDDSTCLRNFPRQERTISVVSIAPETEISVDGSPRRFDVDTIPSMVSTNCRRESLAETSVVSVESVCGSYTTTTLLGANATAIPSHLDTDITPAHVNAEGSSTTPDIPFLDGGVQSSAAVGESFTHDANADFPVGKGYRVKDSFMTQTDLTIPSDDLRMCSTTDALSDKSKPRTPLTGSLLSRENLDTLKRQIASGQCNLRDGLLMELGVTLLPRPERSQSMVVEVPATNSHLEESIPQRELASSQDCGKTLSRFDDGQNAETWDDVNDQQSILDQTLAKLQNMESERAGIISELAELRDYVQVRTEDVTSLLKVNESKQVEFQKKTEETFSKVVRQITESNTGLSTMINNELNVLTEKYTGDFHNLKGNFEGKLENLISKMDDRFSKIDESTNLLLIQQEKLQKQLNHTFQVEAFPQENEIPDGKKMRFVIDVQIYDDCREVLLPMSVKATVGMCKREVLRRIRHQGLIEDDIQFSNVVLMHGTYTLFEEDILADILSPVLQEAEAEGTCVNLKLRVINLRNSKKLLRVSENAEGDKEYISSRSKNSSPAGSASYLQPLPLPTSEQTSQLVETGVLTAALVDDLSQNESLDRRLVCELERMERDTLFQNERVRHVVIAKNALSRTRAALLDRATHSPVEAHRRVARSALAKLDLALGPGATVEELGMASSMAAATLRSITAASGEDERVDIVLEAKRLEEERKQRLVGEIQKLSEEVEKKLRIPVGLVKRAESLTQDAQRAIVLAPSMTFKELDEVYKSLEDFCAVVRTHN